MPRICGGESDSQLEWTALIHATFGDQLACVRLLIDAGADKEAKTFVRVDWYFLQRRFRVIFYILHTPPVFPIATPVYLSFQIFMFLSHFIHTFLSLPLSLSFSLSHAFTLFSLYFPMWIVHLCLAPIFASLCAIFIEWHVLCCVPLWWFCAGCFESDSQDGWTPLMCAAEYGRTDDCARLLIDAGADMHVKNNVRSGHFYCFALILFFLFLTVFVVLCHPWLYHYPSLSYHFTLHVPFPSCIFTFNG